MNDVGMQSISPLRTELALPSAQALARHFAHARHVVCSGVLEPDQVADLRERALALVQRNARAIDQVRGEHVLRYRVVTGDIIRAEWPELFGIYTSSALRSWVAAVAGLPEVFNSCHLQSAININALGEPGDVYRWHTDAAGITLLLYLSSSQTEDGGVLELCSPGSIGTISILPAAGTVVLMDGTRCLHRASPVLRRHERLSVPMVFTAERDHQRPSGLDDYLYRS